jgi:hypothetical protein
LLILEFSDSEIEAFSSETFQKISSLVEEIASSDLISTS